jgi:hypothetical protein
VREGNGHSHVDIPILYTARGGIAKHRRIGSAERYGGGWWDFAAMALQQGKRHLTSFVFPGINAAFQRLNSTAAPAAAPAKPASPPPAPTAAPAPPPGPQLPPHLMEVFVNGESVIVPKNFSVIQACDAAGVDVPR